MKRIYIAGAAGMLGDAFYNMLHNDYKLKCIDKNIKNEWQSTLDFTNRQNYIRSVEEFRPDWLFHIGAETDLEICERNHDYAYDTNSKSVETAVEISNKLDIPILYIGTAGIFSGNKEFFTENDMPQPLGVYAKSKYLGEAYVIAKAKKYLICRAGWMMGGGINKDKKFIGKILKQIINGSNEIHIVNDKLGTPTYTNDFCRNVLNLINNNKYGLYNLVCEGLTSRLEVAKHILKILGLNNSIKLVEVDSNFFKNEYFAPRPDNEQLVNFNFNNLNIGKVKNWDLALTEYLYESWVDELKKIKKK